MTDQHTGCCVSVCTHICLSLSIYMCVCVCVSHTNGWTVSLAKHFTHVTLQSKEAQHPTNPRVQLTVKDAHTHKTKWVQQCPNVYRATRHSMGQCVNDHYSTMNLGATTRYRTNTWEYGHCRSQVTHRDVDTVWIRHGP